MQVWELGVEHPHHPPYSRSGGRLNEMSVEQIESRLTSIEHELTSLSSSHVTWGGFYLLSFYDISELIFSSIFHFLTKLLINSGLHTIFVTTIRSILYEFYY